MYTTAGSGSSYSRPELLRAWLRDAHANLLAPADVVITVGCGERHFAAHRSVLAAHSGYLKAALTGAPPALALPNLNADAFAPLLTFMYSGFLELSHENIYSILLAAHLLHMPRALDQCRAFLVHNQPLPLPPPIIDDVPRVAPSPPLPTLVKPIASRKLLPLMSAWGPLQPPIPPPVPLSSHSSLFRAVQPEQPPSIHDEEDEEISVTDDVTVEPSTSARDDTEQRGTKVVLDVACCDGPVRFHRVLNSNYGVGIDDSQTPDDADEDEARHREEQQQNGGKDDSVYKCLYCNHVFKSHYCYQKHARRHINPVTLDLAKLADRLKQELAAREVRLLDMNVQYYPCKTCGCKFPSYYFVHKHRRLCHPGEVEQEQQAANAAAAKPLQTPTPPPTTSTE